MSNAKYRIGVVATASRFEPVVAERVAAIVGDMFDPGAVELVIHPNAFLESGHFAGDDAARSAAFLDIANDPGFDALWFARGGYGSCRLLETVIPALAPAARTKRYLGYSDAGALLAALYARNFPNLAHGPMPSDVKRDGGEAAVRRALGWLVNGDPAGLEPSLTPGQPAAAFNMTILSQLLGTPFEPDLSGHVLMLEEVGEYMYRIDRTLFHITSHPPMRRIAGLRLGRCSDIPANDPDFGMTAEEVARDWCARSGVAWLGRADIGHDADNRIVPFG
jgi:muramoyltetrapeptide carboxypeptidase